MWAAVFTYEVVSNTQPVFRIPNCGPVDSYHINALVLAVYTHLRDARCDWMR